MNRSSWVLLLIVALLTVLLAPAPVFSQIRLEKISLLNDKVSVLAPKQMAPMSDKMWTTKYRTAKRPLLVLTDENGEVNLLADMTTQAVTEDQMAAYKDFRMQTLSRARNDLQFLGNGVKTVNDKRVGWLKFLSKATDQKVFNYYFFAVLDGKILSFTFNCPAPLQKDWEKTADAIVASLKIK